MNCGNTRWMRDVRHRPLDLGQDSIRFARVQGLPDAVDDQVEFFEDNRAEQGVCSVRRDDCGKDAVPAEQLQPDIADDFARGSTVIGITHGGFAVWDQVEGVDEGLRNHKACRTRVDDCRNRSMQNRFGNAILRLGQQDVAIVCNQHVDREAAHFIVLRQAAPRGFGVDYSSASGRVVRYSDCRQSSSQRARRS